MVATLRLLTRELERPGQHCRHGGGPGARARAHVLSGNVVPRGRCAGLGPKGGSRAVKRGQGEEPACDLRAPLRVPAGSSPAHAGPGPVLGK